MRAPSDAEAARHAAIIDAHARRNAVGRLNRAAIIDGADMRAAFGPRREESDDGKA